MRRDDDIRKKKKKYVDYTTKESCDIFAFHTL